MTQSTGELRCWCQHCGKELEPSHVGKCDSCGKTGKRCEVTAFTTISINSSAIAAVTRILGKEEKRLWLKLISFLKDNIVLDGFEVGFPSGVKIVFRTKKQAR